MDERSNSGTSLDFTGGQLSQRGRRAVRLKSRAFWSVSWRMSVGPGARPAMWHVAKRASRVLPDWMEARTVTSRVSGSDQIRRASATQGVRSERYGPGIGESGMASTLSSHQVTTSPVSETRSTSRPTERSAASAFIAFDPLSQLLASRAHPSL